MDKCGIDLCGHEVYLADPWCELTQIASLPIDGTGDTDEHESVPETK